MQKDKRAGMEKAGVENAGIFSRGYRKCESAIK